MKKKILISVLVIFASIGSIQAIPTIAGSGGDTEHPSTKKDVTKSSEHLRGERNSTLNNEPLESLASEYDISLEGKKLETIQKEMRNALLNGKAKELGISTDGKSSEEIMLELEAAYGKDFRTKKSASNNNDFRITIGDRKNQLIKRANELGIKTDDKDSETIQQEILERMVHNKAGEIGISANNMDMDTLMEKLKKAYEDGK